MAKVIKCDRCGSINGPDKAFVMHIYNPGDGCYYYDTYYDLCIECLKDISLELFNKEIHFDA